MKSFLAIFLGSDASMAKFMALDEQTRKKQEQAGMTGWMKWGTEHKKFIEVEGAPLGKTKKIDAHGVSDTKNQICAYNVIRAETHEAAAKMFVNHPHFTLFPGDSVEVMECLTIPTV